MIYFFTRLEKWPFVQIWRSCSWFAVQKKKILLVEKWLYLKNKLNPKTVFFYISPKSLKNYDTMFSSILYNLVHHDFKYLHKNLSIFHCWLRFVQSKRFVFVYSTPSADFYICLLVKIRVLCLDFMSLKKF